MTTMSPDKHSRTSRTKKSMFGAPIPMLTIETGTRLYLPVMVRKPRSDARTNGAGLASNNVCRVLALECEPTVIYVATVRCSTGSLFNGQVCEQEVLTILFATSPGRIPR